MSFCLSMHFMYENLKVGSMSTSSCILLIFESSFCKDWVECNLAFLCNQVNINVYLFATQCVIFIICIFLEQKISNASQGKDTGCQNKLYILSPFTVNIACYSKLINGWSTPPSDNFRWSILIDLDHMIMSKQFRLVLVLMGILWPWKRQRISYYFHMYTDE